MRIRLALTLRIERTPPEPPLPDPEHAVVRTGDLYDAHDTDTRAGFHLPATSTGGDDDDDHA